MLVDYLAKIDNWLIAFYLPAALASGLYFRRLNSIVMTSLVLAVAELAMFFIREPLLSVASNAEYLRGLRLLAWYGGWSLLNVFFIFMIRFCHVRLNIATSKASYFISNILFVMCVFQTVGYIDSIYWKSPIINTVYQFGIPALNVCMGLIVLISILFRGYNDYIVSNRIVD